MIFGKGKKEITTTPSTNRPLEAAALGRWRSINQAEINDSQSKLPESERLNSPITPQSKVPLWPEVDNSNTQASENIETSSSILNDNSNSDNESDFIQAHIPL